MLTLARRFAPRRHGRGGRAVLRPGLEENIVKPTHPPVRLRAGVIVAALALGMIAAACSDEPEECKRTPEGEFTFRLDPARAGDPYTLTATVEAIEYFAGENPTYEYRLRTPQSQAIVLTLEDMGYSLPVDVGQSYTFDVQNVGGVPAANGIRISDASGLRFMAVTDWRPNFSVFTDGYGSLGDTGTLQVFFQPDGCDPRVEDTTCFLEVRNYRLEFVAGGQRVRLWHRQEAKLAGWRIHAMKASVVKVKSGCPEELQQQISFFVERDGIRAS
jgi:hypothetical protein